MNNNPLRGLRACGQGVWLDYIRRDLISNGELKNLIDEDGLSGMTSNPTIFEKALSGTPDYDEDLNRWLHEDPHTRADVLYERIAIAEIQGAADCLAPVYRSMNKKDGFVSLEVSPGVAHHTQATIAEARRLWRGVARPNLMIKVPATKEGIPAIESLIAEGINVNITLMFTLLHYEKVAQAYIRGLQRCQNPQNVSSVASFFVSRVDTAVDKALEDIGTPEALEMRGQAAIANSRMVYRRFRQIFEGDPFADLKQRGAHLQRPLWASTSTKNPAYADVLYVEELIGRDTVNTMPLETFKLFRDHGKVVEDTVEKGNPEGIMARLSGFDIDINEIGNKLQEEGVKSFTSSFEKLILALKEKTETILSHSIHN